MVSASGVIYDACINEIMTFGIRRCPDPQCKGIIFVAGFIDIKTNSEEIFVFPAFIPLDLDKSRIPSRIIELLEEGIKCYLNGCYIASAIMIRRTLEEICVKEGATGESLKEKIKNLGEKVNLSQPLFDGLNDLRLMGNDAAHVISIVYDEIGEEQAEVAIEFTIELLRALYIPKGLLERLEKLKKKPETDKGA